MMDDSSVSVIAQFLSTFPQRGEAVSISKQDILDAIAFRELVCHNSCLQEQYHRLSKLTPAWNKEWRAVMEERKEQIDETPSHVKLVHCLLRRFEVWSTKTIAKQVLMSTKECSPWLNLPAASYFQRIIKAHDSEDDGNSNAVELPLPPNAYTCQEYLRISQMVALLPPSNMIPPMTECTLFKNSHKRVSITAADLIALWVRAQRNTSARLQLEFLFGIQLAPPRERMCVVAGAGSGKVLRLQVQEDEVRYIATYLGPRKKPCLAKLVDDLVEWAVSNQVLFTSSCIRNAIKCGEIQIGEDLDDDITEEDDDERKPPFVNKYDRKRPLLDAKDAPTPPAKRTRQGNDPELMEACQRYVLRWFARRNRKQVSVIFQSRPTALPMYSEFVKEWLPKCAQQIKSIMDKYDSTDRTLSRIERRDQGADWKSSVLRLLGALEETLTQEQGAIPDFLKLCQLYLDGKTPVEAAEGLLCLDDSQTDPSSILNSFPPPWMDRCCKCQGPCAEGRTFSCCDNCEQLLHTECSLMETKKVVDLFTLPLTLAYAVRIPEAYPRPDFRSRIKWTSIELPIIRKKIKDGQFAPFGMELQSTEKAAAFFDELEAGMLHAQFMERRKDYVAFKIDALGGLIVKEVVPSTASTVWIAETMGIKRNDVIVGVIFNGNQHDFSHLSHHEQDALLKQCSKGVSSLDVLLIQRPDTNILKDSHRWLRRVEKASLSLKQAEKRDIQVCTTCSTRAKANTVLEQAKRCKAVLRRLGMESYSMPFHHELSSLGQDHDDRKHISFRRLDGMMDYIIAKHSTESRETTTLLKAPFFCPLLGEGDVEEGEVCVDQKRLSWAQEILEDKPFDLLCKSMGIMFTLPWAWALMEMENKSDPLLPERTALANHFLPLFCAWCLGSGPPIGAFFARQPWLEEKCCVCLVRPMSCDGVCDNTNCVEIRRLARVQPEIGNGQAPEALELPDATDVEARVDVSEEARLVISMQDRELQCYDELASFVGKCILMLPDDPALGAVEMEARVTIHHEDRPVAFIVASYLPGHFEGGYDEETPDDDGLFRLLPVISTQQLTYLAERQKMRQPPATASLAAEYAWAKLDVLHEPGVLKLKPSEMRRRLKETLAMRDAIDRCIAGFGQRAEVSAPLSIGESVPLSCDYEGGKGECEFSCESMDGRLHQCQHSNTLAIELCARYKRILDILFNCDPTIGLDLARCAGANDEISLVEGDDTDYELSDGEEDRHRQLAVVPIPEVRQERMHFPVGDNEPGDEGAEQQMPLGDEEVVFANPTGRVAPRALLNSVVEILDGTESDASFVVEHRDPDHAQRFVRCFATDRHFENQVLAQPYRKWRDREEMLLHCTFIAIVLSRSALDDPTRRGEHNQGPGWGFEVIQFTDEQHSYRVGRVQPNSPASRAGLLMNDVIVTVGGMEIQGTESQSSLTAAIYGQSLVEDNDTADSLLERIGTPRTDPIVIVVGRFSHANTNARIAAVTPPLALELNRGASTSFSPVVQGDAANNRRQWRVQTRENQDDYPRLNPEMQIDPHQPNPPLRLPSPGHAGGGQVVRFLTADDLNLSGLHGTLLTRVETAVVVHAITVAHLPSLGTRLLCPRYNWHAAVGQSATFRQADVSYLAQLPRIHPDFWIVLLERDRIRAIEEKGDIVATDGQYAYRIPTVGLALDRAYEDFLQQFPPGSSPVHDLHIPNPNLFHALMPRNRNAQDEIERIRGGGPNALADNCSLNKDASEAFTKLATLPRANWTHQAVRCEVDVADGLPRIMLGFVEDFQCVDATMVRISVVHISGLGMLEDCFEDVESSALDLVKENTLEASILLEWQNEYDTGGKYLTPRVGDVIRTDTGGDKDIEVEEKSGSGLIPARCKSQNTPLVGATRSLIKRLCQRSKGSTPIGQFPDGRTVLWYAGDPGALYICEDSSEGDREIVLQQLQQEYCRLLGQNSLGEHVDVGHLLPPPSRSVACPWGCSCPHDGKPSRRQALFFGSKVDLMYHLVTCHGHVSPEGGMVRVGEGTWRVCAGDSIRQIASSLAASICARCPTLLECTVPCEYINDDEVCSPLDHSIVFDTDRFLDFSEQGRGAVAERWLVRLQGNADAQQLCRLYSRIARLWDVESDGLYRLSADDTPACLRRVPAISFADLQSTCYMQSSQATGLIDCDLCGLDSEKVLCLNGRSRSLGCMPLSVACFPAQARTGPIREGCSLLARAKNLMLNVASHLPPDSLRRESADAFELRKYLWEEQNYQAWYQQVESCNSLNLALQALVVLLYSIDKEKMPTWWKSSKSGWSSAYAVMSLPSLSSLALYLYVMDAAVCEYSANTLSKVQASSLPPGLQILSKIQRMAQVVAWATAIDLPRYKDDRSCNCTVCGEGGCLLACEFCEQVQHAECAQIAGHSELSEWVCGSCTKDIAMLHEASIE